MKQHFNKVIVESPRACHDRKYGEHRTRQNRMLDDEVGGKITKNFPSFRDKSFGEHLNPLYRWIEKQVNRPWDKVYSEIVKQFDPRKVINRHILEHVYDRVEKPEHTIFVDGEIKFFREWSRWGKISYVGLEDAQDMYVDPRDGILKANRRKKTRRQAREETYRKVEAAKRGCKIIIDKTQELWKIKGTWFLLRIRKVPEPTIRVANPYEGNLYEYKARMEWAQKTANMTDEMKLAHGGIPVEEYNFKSILPPTKDVGPLPEGVTVWHEHWLTPGVATSTFQLHKRTRHLYDRYYASMETAGKKLLKKHGLLK